MSTGGEVGRAGLGGGARRRAERASDVLDLNGDLIGLAAHGRVAEVAGKTEGLEQCNR